MPTTTNAKHSPAVIAAAVERVLSTEAGRRMVAEVAADRMLQSNEGRRRMMREERAVPVEGSGDVLDFIVHGGPASRKAMLGRLALTLVSSGLLSVREAARIVGCSVQSIYMLKAKFESQS